MPASRGQYRLWVCAACERSTRYVHKPSLADGWLNYHGARFCFACWKRIEAEPLGASLVFERGKLVRVSRSHTRVNGENA